jgi:histone acetyltransferase (RNA polymerase elongator complex component)
MDEEALRLSGRGHSAEDTRRAAALVKKRGFRLVLQMMTGLPGSSDEKDIATARELIALGPDAVRIYPAVVIRGTAMEEMWRSGAYIEHTVEDAVRVCAEIVPLFDSAGIPVIRLGLNPTEELSAGSAVAGAYHPALGELVRSRILRRKAEELLADAAPGSEALLYVPAQQLSQMIGQKKENTLWLRQRFALRSLRVIPSEEEELRAEIKE